MWQFSQSFYFNFATIHFCWSWWGKLGTTKPSYEKTSLKMVKMSILCIHLPTLEDYLNCLNWAPSLNPCGSASREMLSHHVRPQLVHNGLKHHYVTTMCCRIGIINNLRHKICWSKPVHTFKQVFIWTITLQDENVPRI